MKSVTILKNLGQLLNFGFFETSESNFKKILSLQAWST